MWKFFRGMILNAYGHPGGFVFLKAECQKRGLNFSWWEYDLMVVILLSFLCSYVNLALQLHQEKRSYPDESMMEGH